MTRLPDSVIEQFADHLVPEAFTRPTSAYRVRLGGGRSRGRAAFLAWVAARIEEVRTHTYPAGGRPARSILLEDDRDVLWHWEGEPCCPPSAFAQRVRRELDDVAEPWLVGVLLDPPSPSWEGIDPLTGEWTEFGHPVWLRTDGSLRWYAEARGRGVAQVLGGVIHLDHDVETDTEVIVRRESIDPRRGELGAYHRVLHGHPSRRAHRLGSGGTSARRG